MENSKKPESELNNIRTGYQSAVSMAIYEGSLPWTAMQSFAPLLLALIAASAADNLPFVSTPWVLAFLKLTASVMGVVICVFWYSATARSRLFQKYWIACARELEKEMQGVTTLQDGKNLPNGDTVTRDTTTIKISGVSALKHSTTLSFFYVFSGGVFCLFTITNLVNLISQLSQLLSR